MKKTKRRASSISSAAMNSVLLKSRRRCALCFAAGDDAVKEGDLVHILPKSVAGTDDADNLVFLCAKHNRAFDSDAASLDELRAARNALYHAAFEKPATSSSRPKIFLAHGPGDASKDQVARFLHSIGAEPVVLFEQTTLGETVLDKLGQAADAGYAVVVLSPDEPVPGGVRHRRKARARPNVILELGYLLGLLGRNRVCALYHPDVEVPSDLLGILYTEMDKSGRWRKVLARELCDAGLPVSAATRD